LCDVTTRLNMAPKRKNAQVQESKGDNNVPGPSKSKQRSTNWEENEIRAILFIWANDYTNSFIENECERNRVKRVLNLIAIIFKYD